MSLKSKLEFLILLFFAHIFKIIGINKARYFAGFFAIIFFYFIPIRKGTVLENLRIAFPELTIQEIRKTAFKNYYSFVLTLIEILCLPFMSREQLISLVYCPDIHLIKEKLDENKGVILFTAHFGNWEVGAASVGAQLNIPIQLVAKQQSNQYVSDWLNMAREKFGNKVTLLGMSIKNIYKELLNKNIIGIVGDQRGPKEGLRIKFFNRDTSVYPGTALLAVKTNAPIVTAFVERQKDKSYITHLKIIDVNCFSGTDDEKVAKINQEYMNLLESFIRKNPEQWFWMHKIWKY